MSLLRNLFTALILCVTGTIWSQGFPVAGRLTDASTGAPIARATLVLAPLLNMPYPAGRQRFFGRSDSLATLSAVSGPEGYFAFPVVQAGHYQMSASARGFLTSRLDEEGNLSAAVIVGPRADSSHIRFPLQRAASIEGSVRDSSGDPVGSGSVTLFYKTEDEAQEVRQIATQAVNQRSNDSSFFFSNLRPGTYYLAATATPWFAQSSASVSTANGSEPNPLDVAYPLTFFDGATSEENAQPIPLSAGADVHADLTLQAVPAVHLHVSQPGGSSAGIFPRFRQSAFGSDLSAPVSADVFPGQNGAMESVMTLAPGSYTIVAGGARRSFSADASESITEAELSPPSAQPVPVSGELGMANGHALPPGVQLTLMPFTQDAPRQQFNLDFAGRRGDRNGDPFSPVFLRRPIDVAVGPNGRFQTSAAPDAYRLEAATSSGAPLLVTAAAATGGTVSPSLILQVDATPVVLAATLAVADASLTGTVLGSDGRPRAGTMVLLIPADPSAAVLYRQAESATDGGFQLDQLPAGSYRIVAIHDGWDLKWKTPSVIAPYFGAAVAVTLAPAQALALPHPLAAVSR